MFLLVPLTQGLETSGGNLSFADLDRLGYLTIGGLVAVWLNSLVLSTSAFARERENGTMTILRRIAPDWRFVFVAKLGYVVLSSIALASFFFLVSLGVDLKFRLPLLTTCASFARSDVGADATTFIAGFGLLSTFGWRFFWTNFVSRQIAAIFLAFLCLIVGGIMAWNFARGIEHDEVVPLFLSWHFGIGLTLTFLAAIICRLVYRLERTSRR